MHVMIAGQYYSLTQRACMTCPAGIDCSFKPLAKDNFFVMQDRVSGAYVSFQCEPGYCLNGASCDSSSSVSSNDTDNTNTTTIAVNATSTGGLVPSGSCCAAHRLPASQNVLCSRCEDGYVPTLNGFY